MSKRRVLLYLAISTLISLVAIPAEAQATRTWVSGVGDDVNPCSQPAPCKSFAGALSKTANGGEIDCLGPGGFGVLTITQSVTIDCSLAPGGISNAGGTVGITINNPNAFVRIRGVDITGGGTGSYGIRILAAAKVHIERSAIDGNTSHGISIENTGSGKVVIDSMTIRNNLGSAVNVQPAGTSDVTIIGSTLSTSAAGLSTGANSTVWLMGNTFAYNTSGIGTPARGATINSFGNNAFAGNINNTSPTRVSLQ